MQGPRGGSPYTILKGSQFLSVKNLKVCDRNALFKLKVCYSGDVMKKLTVDLY